MTRAMESASLRAGMMTLTLIATFDTEPLKTAGFMLPAALLGFATLGFLYVAFFPPVAFQSWLLSREARAEG